MKKVILRLDISRNKLVLSSSNFPFKAGTIIPRASDIDGARWRRVCGKANITLAKLALVPTMIWLSIWNKNGSGILAGSMVFRTADELGVGQSAAYIHHLVSLPGCECRRN